MTTPAKTKRFRVALSFPGEKRGYIRLVAESLANALGKERVLYDDYLTAELARPDLDLYLGSLYRNESDLVVPFYCSEYNAKNWCRLEWRQMRDILLNMESSRIMPFRFDDAAIDGVLSVDGYVKIGAQTPAEVANLIFQRLELQIPTTVNEKKHRTFISKLPTINTLLIGRDDQLAFLDQAWENPATNFVQIIAPGGTGKTALMDKWFRRHIGEADVFGWSFYSQGVSTKNVTSSDSFFAQIMGWLNIELPATTSVYTKAEAVAERLRKKRTLLLLDGIEPLQDSLGVLLDSAMKALLQELSAENEGLVLCTTRVRLDIPDDFPRVISIDLGNLTPVCGAEYLRQLKVVGEEDELQQASRDCGNHALALTLLGTYLADFLDADIRRRFEIREFMIDDLKPGAQARRMMAAYENMFAGKPEAAILRVLGFFDRPVEPEALKLVLPVMRALEYRAALNRLYNARLVLARDPMLPIDCHPLIREHFATVMRSKAAEEFQEGHSNLYEHYCQQAHHQPDTLDGMKPLFHAIYHGCQAGWYLEAFDSVYLERINRGNKLFLTKTLGAVGIDLSLLANFFATPWSQPISVLPADKQRWILAQSGFSLRDIGRLADALAPIQAAAEQYAREKQRSEAALCYGQRSKLLLSLGYVDQAISAFQESVRWADESGNKFEQIGRRTYLADALLQSGQLLEAQCLFEEADRMQSQHEPERPILYALRGSRYCNLLLEEDHAAEVICRATQTLRWAEAEQWLLEIGLDHVSLGRAYCSGSPESLFHLDQGVELVRQSGVLEQLPLALLARGTPRDLDEVFRIATRSSMRLYLTDYYLASSRVATNDGDLMKARDHFEKAETLVSQTGYHRRDKNLDQLRTELTNKQSAIQS